LIISAQAEADQGDYPSFGSGRENREAVFGFQSSSLKSKRPFQSAYADRNGLLSISGTPKALHPASPWESVDLISENLLSDTSNILFSQRYFRYLGKVKGKAKNSGLQISSDY